MQKYFVFLAASTVMLSGCGQDYNQANILNTKSAKSPTSVDITLPDPIDDETFFATERKTIKAHMNDVLTDLEKNPSTEKIDTLLDDVQKLLMSNPYEKNWQNQIDALKQQVLQLKVMVENKEGGLQTSIKTIQEALNELA